MNSPFSLVPNKARPLLQRLLTGVAPVFLTTCLIPARIYTGHTVLRFVYKIPEWALFSPCRNYGNSWRSVLLTKSVSGVILQGFTKCLHRKSNRNNVPDQFGKRTSSLRFTRNLEIVRFDISNTISCFSNVQRISNNHNTILMRSLSTIHDSQIFVNQLHVPQRNDSFC